MKLRTRLLITVFAISGIVSISCSKKTEVEEYIVRPVRYQKVSLSGGKANRSFSGVSKAGVEANLSFKVSGTLRSINVKVGDKVKKGSLIASLDKTDLQLMYERATVALNNAKVQMQSAKSAFERVSALYENNNASLQDYEGARTAYESAKAMVSSNKRSLQLAGSQLSYGNLRAPMDGIVAQVTVEKNENVMTGQPVIELHSSDDCEVTVGVPETYISRIKEGEMVDVMFSSIADRRFKGTISEVSYTINSESSTYPVSIVLLKPTKEIRPGMAADVIFHFASDSSKDCIVVPVNTVAEDQKGRFVYTITEKENNLATVHKRSVRIGALTREGIEIVEGLEDGELIVTAGISKLSDSMIVKLLK